MGVIDAGRRAAESMMTVTLDAFSPGFAVMDGMKVPAPVPQGSTPGKVQAGSDSSTDPATRTVVVGGMERPVLAGGLHIPIGAPVPEPGDLGVGWEYVVAAVGPLDDPALLNKRFLVVSVPVKSKATARRLDVVEVA